MGDCGRPGRERKESDGIGVD
uniref:Uncharacterized protein n=1 Tax=Anguilla anguilla TaxID=7936 RepID=A0A0E9RG05_ANGAN